MCKKKLTSSLGLQQRLLQRARQKHGEDLVLVARSLDKLRHVATNGHCMLVVLVDVKITINMNQKNK